MHKREKPSVVVLASSDAYTPRDGKVHSFW